MGVRGVFNDDGDNDNDDNDNGTGNGKGNPDAHSALEVTTHRPRGNHPQAQR